MNPQQMLIAVQEAIETRPPSTSKSYHICIQEGEICCLPQSHGIEQHPVFFILREKELRDGLTNPQWEILLKALANHFTERDKCPKNPTLLPRPK